MQAIRKDGIREVDMVPRAILSDKYCAMWIPKNRNTANALLQFEQSIQATKARKQYTVAIFFDIGKAYDIAWRRGVIETLHECGLRGHTPVFVSNLLVGRRICQNWKGALYGERSTRGHCPRKCIVLYMFYDWNEQD